MKGHQERTPRCIGHMESRQDQTIPLLQVLKLPHGCQSSPVRCEAVGVHHSISQPHHLPIILHKLVPLPALDLVLGQTNHRVPVSTNKERMDRASAKSTMAEVSDRKEWKARVLYRCALCGGLTVIDDVHRIRPMQQRIMQPRATAEIRRRAALINMPISVPSTKHKVLFLIITKPITHITGLAQ